jgi:hypothetical protein
MADQEQFLQVLNRDEAERRFLAALNLSPSAIERIPLEAALGRTLAEHVVSPVDVPSFDRANVDGFAVVAEDTYGASEEVPRKVKSRQRTHSYRHHPHHHFETRHGCCNRNRRDGPKGRRRCRHGGARRNSGDGPSHRTP